MNANPVEPSPEGKIKQPERPKLLLVLPGEKGLAAFIAELGKLRVWGREPSVKLGKASPLVK